MVFSSLPFLFFFLPAFLILYYLFPFKAKNYVLLVFSLVFYAWGEPVYILLMLFSAFVDYLDGILLEKFGTTTLRRRIFLFTAIGINLSLLAFFKYADFAVGIFNHITPFNAELPGIALPIGISFYTFQTMSYSIDVYKKRVKAERNYFTYLTYVSMFPQLIAGPIVRFSTVQEELHKREIKESGFVLGFKRFLMGLMRKILIANQIGALWDSIRGAENISTVTAWLGLLCFTLQLYYDFSAYSDMAYLAVHLVSRLHLYSSRWKPRLGSEASSEYVCRMVFNRFVARSFMELCALGTLSRGSSDTGEIRLGKRLKESTEVRSAFVCNCYRCLRLWNFYIRKFRRNGPVFFTSDSRCRNTFLQHGIYMVCRKLSAVFAHSRCTCVPALSMDKTETVLAKSGMAECRIGMRCRASGCTLFRSGGKPCKRYV